jgi:hypothetical protein
MPVFEFELEFLVQWTNARVTLLLIAELYVERSSPLIKDLVLLITFPSFHADFVSASRFYTDVSDLALM